MISVVIPARNAQATIGAQLDGLALQDATEPWELIVVDNGSTDDTARIARSYADRIDLTVLQQRRPGVNAARNAGIDAARGQRLLFTDADDIVEPSWVRGMADGLAGGGITGGWFVRWVLDDDPPHCLDAEPVSAIFQGNFLPYPVGCCSGVHREVVDDVGPFSTEIPYGGDEVEFFWRAQLGGHEIHQAPAPAVMVRRERAGLRAVAAQSRTFGRAEVDLSRRFERAGYPARFRRRVPLRLLRHLPALVTARGDARREAVQRVSFNLGALRGLIGDGRGAD